MKKIVVFGIAALLSSSVFAAPETYMLEANHSYSRFAYKHLGFSTQHHRFDKTTGKITLDKAAKTGAVDVSIDMKSVSTGSTVFNEHIQGADFFDTANHPTATFKSTAVKFEGDKPVVVEGNLTLKGVTKPVTLSVTHFHNAAHPMMKKDTIGADATVVVKRSDFNMAKNVPFVGDEVTISLAVEAIKE